MIKSPTEGNQWCRGVGTSVMVALTHWAELLLLSVICWTFYEPKGAPQASSEENLLSSSLAALGSELECSKWR